jgi:hypothetical protein
MILTPERIAELRNRVAVSDRGGWNTANSNAIILYLLDAYESLKEANERLRAALEKIANSRGANDIYTATTCLSLGEIARAALAGEKEKA